MAGKINYFKEDISFRITKKEVIQKWISFVIKSEGRKLNELNLILCSDEYLLNVNKEYLQHDYYTDIITFDNSENEDISGDLFISIDRVKDNAEERNIDFRDEFHRVIVHGVLHLLGYKDKSKKDEQLIRAKEDAYLASRRAFL